MGWLSAAAPGTPAAPVLCPYLHTCVNLCLLGQALLFGLKISDAHETRSCTPSWITF